VHGLIAAYGYSDIQVEYQFLSSEDELGAKNFLERTGCSEQTAVELCLKDLSLTSLQISVPTLIIHPQNDSVVPVSAADQIASQVTDPTLLTKDIVTEAGIDHFFLNKEDNAGYTAAQKTITDWLTTNL
jgi:alpha-beta hydrolase superfamily lysophospholipase